MSVNTTNSNRSVYAVLAIPALTLFTLGILSFTFENNTTLVVGPCLFIAGVGAALTFLHQHTHEQEVKYLLALSALVMAVGIVLACVFSSVGGFIYSGLIALVVAAVGMFRGWDKA